MTSITIALPDDVMHKLQQLAKRHQLAPEELVRVTVEELVAAPQKESFEAVMDYVLSKNEELYTRLAA